MIGGRQISKSHTFTSKRRLSHTIKKNRWKLFNITPIETSKDYLHIYRILVFQIQQGHGWLNLQHNYSYLEVRIVKPNNFETNKINTQQK